MIAHMGENETNRWLYHGSGTRWLILVGGIPILFLATGTIWSGTRFLVNFLNFGAQILLFLCLLPFIPCLLFTIPFCRALKETVPSQNPQEDATEDVEPSVATSLLDLCQRLGLWIFIWLIAGLAVFLIGYINSAGIRYYQEPLGLWHRLGHGVRMVGLFFAPTLYLFTAGLYLAPRALTTRPLVFGTHMYGFGVYAVTATVMGFLVFSMCPFLDFRIPSGYNPGFINPDPVILYTTFIGIIAAVFGIYSSWSKRRLGGPFFQKKS